MKRVGFDDSCLPSAETLAKVGASPGLEGHATPLWLRTAPPIHIKTYVYFCSYKCSTWNICTYKARQNEKRTPSCTCLLGNAEVKANGVLDETMPPPARAVPGLIPFTLKVVKPGSKPNRGLTSLFTLA